MEQLKSCPNCGAPIEDHKCPYCGTVFYDVDVFIGGKPANIRLADKPTINGSNIITGKINADLLTTGTLNTARIKNGYIMTNGDRIRRMTDEELNDWFCEVKSCIMCKYWDAGCHFLEWLKEEETK